MDERIKDPTIKKNERITEVIHMFHQEPTERLLLAVILAVREIMQQDGHLVFPADIGANENGNLTFGFKTMEWDGCTAIVAFTDPEELKKSVPTWAGLPLHIEHHIDSAEDPQKLTRVGTVGTEIRWNEPYIDAPLTVWDQTAIDGIEDGMNVTMTVDNYGSSGNSQLVGGGNSVMQIFP